MKRILKVIVIGAIGSMLSIPVIANTLSVSCRISDGGKHPDIWFAGITSENIDINNYGESGNLSMTATVSGNGNTAVFSRQTNYTKVENRLELTNSWLTIPVTMEEFKEHFGLFPKITCTSP